MTQDEIIEMARQAGFLIDDNGMFLEDEETLTADSEILEAFAKLVAAKVEEVLAEEYMTDIHRAIKIEREACAKVVETLPPIGVYRQLERATFKDAAIAIRARGEA